MFKRGLICLLVVCSGCHANHSPGNGDAAGWYKALPDCPCRNPDLTGVKLNDGWAKDKGDTGTYHAGAAECFRSYPPVKTAAGNSGQQCCYDKAGNLITGGTGAGTPDKVSTAGGEDKEGVMTTRLLAIPGHYRQDVAPWRDLGGKDSAWKEYNTRWVPNKGNGCPENQVIE